MADKPIKIKVTQRYLAKFPQPFWDKLDLENNRVLSAIEGKHEDGYRFTVIETEHTAFGPFSDERSTAITTFGIVAIPQSIVGRHISWQPRDYQVATDSDYVYLAKPGYQVPPGDWRDLIEMTVKTTESLVESGDAAAITRPSYRPVGAGAFVHVFWALCFLAFAVLLLGMGFGIMFGWVDYRDNCVERNGRLICETAWRGWEAFKKGGGSLLAGLFLLCGAAYYYGKARIRFAHPSR